MVRGGRDVRDLAWGLEGGGGGSAELIGEMNALTEGILRRHRVSMSNFGMEGQDRQSAHQEGYLYYVSLFLRSSPGPYHTP